MRYFRKLIIIFIPLILIVGLISSGCSYTAKDKVKVVTGSSLLTCIVKELGGDNIEVINLIPPA
jgi:zinc transport system substrate-binding protein